MKADLGAAFLFTFGVAIIAVTLAVLHLVGLLNVCKCADVKPPAPQPVQTPPSPPAAPAAPPAAASDEEDESTEEGLMHKLARLHQLKACVFILGQTGCGACQKTKEYIKEKGYGDMTVFIDLARFAAMLKDESKVPKKVADKLGRGVPVIIAADHRAGWQVLDVQEGFHPKRVDEVVGKARAIQ
jgi:glutaredoxin